MRLRCDALRGQGRFFGLHVTRTWVGGSELAEAFLWKRLTLTSRPGHIRPRMGQRPSPSARRQIACRGSTSQADRRWIAAAASQVMASPPEPIDHLNVPFRRACG